MMRVCIFTDRERDHVLVRIGVDAQIVHDGPDGVVRVAGDAGRSYVPRSVHDVLSFITLWSLVHLSCFC